MSDLHVFDLLLCDYVHVNLRNHLENKAFLACIDVLDVGLKDYIHTRFRVAPLRVRDEPPAEAASSQSGSVDSDDAPRLADVPERAQALVADAGDAQADHAQVRPSEIPAAVPEPAQAPAAEAGEAQATPAGPEPAELSTAGAVPAQTPTEKIELVDVPAPATDLPFLLSDDELKRLESVVAAANSIPGSKIMRWQASRVLHAEYVFCTGEINRRLSPVDAERWAKMSLRFAKQLESRGLWLEDGIAFVSDWVAELRRCLAAMDETNLLPKPYGRFQTPTNPAKQKKGKGGRPEEWGELVRFADDKKNENPSLQDKQIVAAYNQLHAKDATADSEGKKKIATVRNLRDARYARKILKRKSD